MGFKGITDKEVAEELKKRAGIARPGPKEFLLDALGFAPALLGMPMLMTKPAAIRKMVGKQARKKLKGWELPFEEIE